MGNLTSDHAFGQQSHFLPCICQERQHPIRENAPTSYANATGTADAFGWCRSKMERPPLRVGAAVTGMTRPSGQQGTQEISVLSAGKGGRRDPHPGLGANTGQQSTPASFQQQDSTGHLCLAVRRARKSHRAQLCEGQGLHLLCHQGCRGGASFPTSFSFRGKMYNLRAAYKLVPKFTLLLSYLQHRALGAGLGTNLPCPAPNAL